MPNPGRLFSRSLAAAVLCASAVASGCASPAFTGEGSGDDESSFSREGAYIGVYGIKSYERFDTGGNGVSVGDSDLGIGAKLGYRFSSNVALEVVGEDVKGFSVQDSSADADLDLMNFGVIGKYYLGTERLQPYLLAGIGLARADVRGFDYDDDGGFLRFGVGLEIYLTTNFAFFGEANYNRMIGGVSDLDHVDLQAGVMFRF